MSDQTSEFHVAQQSRRERLRVTNSEEMDILHQPYQYRHISYDPSLVLSSSEMINFATTSTDVTQHNVGMQQHSTSCGWNNVGIENNLSPMFVGGGGVLSSGSLNLNSNVDVKPSFYSGYTDMQQSVPGVTTNLSTTSNVEFGSSTSVLYHDTLQEVVTSATGGNQGVETGRVGLWNENRSYIDQSRLLYHKSCEFGTNASAKGPDNTSAQGLVLSLSPVPQSRANAMQMDKRNNASIVPDNFAIAHRSAVPLGPFTGYATILKSSKFLRPAQQLLDELCDLAAGSSSSIRCSSYTKKYRDGFRVSSEGYAGPESSSGGGGIGGDSSGLNESNVRPEYLQKKAKLIFMQEEVC